MACNAPAAGSESPNNPNWCYTGSCNASGGFIMDNCMWDNEHVLEQFNPGSDMISMNYGPDQVATPLRGQRVEYPDNSTKPIRRSRRTSNGHGEGSSNKGLFIVIAIIGAVAYFIYKK